MMAKSMPVLLPRAKAPFMPGSMSPTTMSACSSCHHRSETCSSGAGHHVKNIGVKGCTGHAALVHAGYTTEKHAA